MRRRLLPTWLIVLLGLLAAVLLCVMYSAASADGPAAPTEAQRVFERAAPAVVAVVIPPPPMPVHIERGAGAREVPPLPEGAEVKETELGVEILVDPEKLKGDLPMVGEEPGLRPPGKRELKARERIARAIRVHPPAAELTAGFLIDREGRILTILPGEFVVDELHVEWLDGTKETCRVTARDPMSGLCLLESQRADLPEPLEWGDDKALRVGSTVYAISHPDGFRHSLDRGLVAGLDRNPQAPEARQPGGMIQTTLEVRPGSAGAPLLDAGGKVVGVRTQGGRPHAPTPAMIFNGRLLKEDLRALRLMGLPGPAAPGIDLAMPASQVRDLVEQLRVHGRVRRGWLGVQISDLGPKQRQALDLPEDLSGVLINRVFETSAADAAGLRNNDVVLAIDDHPVTTTGEMVRAVQAHKPGDRVTLAVWREGARTEMPVTLWDQPEQL